MCVCVCVCEYKYDLDKKSRKKSTKGSGDLPTASSHTAGEENIRFACTPLHGMAGWSSISYICQHLV